MGLRQLSEKIEYLERAELTYSEIINIEPILDIIGAPVVGKVTKTAYHRWYKWFNKRGSELEGSPTANFSIKTLRGFFRKAFLEALHRVILGYYGVTAGDTMSYVTLGYRASKLTLKFRGEALDKMLKECIDEWKLRFNVDEKIAKVIVLASAKATVYLANNDLKLLQPVLSLLSSPETPKKTSEKSSEKREE